MKNLPIIFSRNILVFCLLVLILGSYESSFCQVSFSVVKKDILKQYSGVTVVDRGGGRVEVDKSYIPNRRFYHAYARVSNKDKIEGHNVNHHRDVVVTYEILGGKNVYSSMTKSVEWLTGDLIPPNLNEVSEIAKKDPKNFFESYLLNYMTDFSGIKEIVKEKYDCFECDNFHYSVVDQGKSVGFRVIINYSRLNGNSHEKREDMFNVTLKRDGINQPWKTGNAARASTGDKLIEQKELTSDESQYWECNTLGIKLQKELAVEEYNKLPKVEIPKLKTAQETAWWLHKFLRKTTPPEAEYVFLTMLQPWYFLKCGSYMLNESGYKLVESVKKMVTPERGNYGDFYCEYPDIKEQSGNEKDYRVAYYQKNGTYFSRIRIADFKGEFKISDITLSKSMNKDDIDAVMAVPDSKCKDSPKAFWRNFKLNEVNISAAFPAEPKKESASDKYALRLSFNNAEYYISGEKTKSDFVNLIKDQAKKSESAKQYSEETRKKFDATAGKDEVWQCRGARGYASTWRANIDGKPTEIKYRSIVFKDIFYQIWVAGNFDPKDVSQFFDSITIDR